MSFISVQMAKRGGHNGPIDDGLDKATTIRPSSTANFFVDSTDKDPLSPSSTNFTINKNQALFNGFFSRIAVNEVVLDWGIPNIAQAWGNNFLTVSVNPGGGATTGTTYTITLADGFYSALDALNAIVLALNAASGMTATFSVDSTTLPSQVQLKSTQAFLVVWEQTPTGTVPSASRPYYDPGNALARALFSSSQLYQVPPNALPAPVSATQFALLQRVMSPLILGTRYIDFVSPQLTYNQDLKDNTTAVNARDSLYRWYFAWDTNSGTDIITGTPSVYPYYILQGYKPFNQRRILPYPKQIRWENSQPIGQVSFQVYDDRGRLIDTSLFTPSGNIQFQMSMLLSEN